MIRGDRVLPPDTKRSAEFNLLTALFVGLSAYHPTTDAAENDKRA
jgi:hypothetical protein